MATTVLVVVWLIAALVLIVTWGIYAIRSRRKRARNREELSILDDLTYYDRPPAG